MDKRIGNLKIDSINSRNIIFDIFDKENKVYSRKDIQSL